MYQIIRFYESGKREVIARGVTLVDAQRHCNDPETSSRTATSEAAKTLTERYGRWFDAYQEAEDYVTLD
jgi:hypothetical protein